MILNIWSTIRDFFINLFSNFSLNFIIYLLLGIFIGFLIGLIIYLSFLMVSKKKEKKIKEVVVDIEKNQIDSDKVYEIIEQGKNAFKYEIEGYSLTQQLQTLESYLLLMTKEIVKIYYPKSKDSKNLLLEISIDEAIDLVRRIDRKVDKFLEANIATRILKTKKIKLIPDSLEKMNKKKDRQIIEKPSFFKQAFQNIMSKAKAVFGIDKLINVGLEKIYNILFNVVGVEVSKTYSKGNFIERPNTKDINNDTVVSEVVDNE